MGVPTELALDAVAVHRPVAGHDVLDHRLQQVPVVRGSRGERRAVVERVLGVWRTLLDLFDERIRFVPEAEDAGVQRREVDLRRHACESRSGWLLVAHRLVPPDQPLA